MSREVRIHEASDWLKKLLRKARRDAWDDAAQKAFDLGWISDAHRLELQSRNPSKGCWG